MSDCNRFGPDANDIQWLTQKEAAAVQDQAPRALAENKALYEVLMARRAAEDNKDRPQ